MNSSRGWKKIECSRFWNFMLKSRSSWMLEIWRESDGRLSLICSVWRSGVLVETHCLFLPRPLWLEGGGDGGGGGWSSSPDLSWAVGQDLLFQGGKLPFKNLIFPSSSIITPEHNIKTPSAVLSLLNIADIVKWLWETLKLFWINVCWAIN